MRSTFLIEKSKFNNSDIGESKIESKTEFLYDQKNNRVQKTYTSFGLTEGEELLLQTLSVPTLGGKEDIDTYINKYKYDSNNNLIEEIDEEDDFIRYKYDSNNNLIEEIEGYYEKIIFGLKKTVITKKREYVYEFYE